MEDEGGEMGWRERKEAEKNKRKRLIRWAIIGFIGMILLFVSSLFTISAGQRGIVSTFGNPTDRVYTEGLHFKFPLVQSVDKLDVKTQLYSSEATAASRDLQEVHTNIAVNYHLSTELLRKLYLEVGTDYGDRLIVPTTQEVVKASTAQFTAEELITRRPEAKAKILELLSARLHDRGIIVEDISITNFDFSQSFNQAIEAKATAEQLKLKAERDLERVKVEADQKIAQAQAEATALNLQKQQITPDLIKLRQIEAQIKAIEKWDGKLPTFTGNGAIPFIDINSVNVNN